MSLRGTPGAGVHTVRVALPHHLRVLAGSGPEVTVQVSGEVTVHAVLDALEAAHPELRGTIRDHGTGARRAYLRYFACGEDLSHRSAADRLPEEVRRGEEPLTVLGAISGG